MASFRQINMNGLIDGDAAQARLKTLSREAAPIDGLQDARARIAAASEDSAGRLFLQTYLEDAGSETLAAVTAPERPEVMPDMRVLATGAVPQLQANSVAYQQTAHAIPIFGGRVVVDVDAADHSLVAINGKVTPLPDVNPIASVSAQAAWERLLAWSDAGPVAIPSPPVLTWYLDEDDGTWRLVHHFAGVPISPPAEDLPPGLPEIRHSCVRHSHHDKGATYDYFVDAHDGEVAFYFASAPTLDVPAPMQGVDCYNVLQQFFGLQAAGGGYILRDPMRNIETYDYAFADIDQNTPIPNQPFSHPAANLGNVSPQAVSAHYHAQLVYDFYNGELKRDGIDDKGMKLISVVNVWSSVQNPLPPKQWGNAAWWQGKMWYGEENGQSFAKYLDVIAHELTHGVTSTTSNLIYRRLPGALNESFSDVFGVIIANWFPAAPNPVSTWKWDIGPGLGSGGGPLRDFANPATAGQPDHMNQYQVWPVTRDNGGVHYFSGIHNKAVHGLLSAVDAAGQPAFPTRDLVLLLYLTLTRLTPTSDFSDSRKTLENVTSIYYAADPVARAARLATIATAYNAVGIV